MAIAGLYGLVRGKEGLGFGDVRLLGAMGMVLGPYVLVAYALANILGVLGAIPAIISSSRAHSRGVDTASEQRERAPLSIPFGPFLAAAGVITALWGPTVWAWYLRLLGVG